MEKTDSVSVCVKWDGREWQVGPLPAEATVAALREAIRDLTGVMPQRQKLLNLKLKSGKALDDASPLSELNLKPGFKVMMMGSLEKAIQVACEKPADATEVVDDLDIEEEEIAIENADVYLQKVERRVRELKIEVFQEPRPGMKLLVLDIDYTLFDHRSAAETGYELMRPYLHEFLTSAYEQYDIVIWSATGMKYINEKMKLLNVSSHQDYKIMFHLDSSAMITVHAPKYGVIQVKPLGVIWGKYPQYGPKNTIMFDDIRRNFIMNPRSGLKIRPFRQAHLNRGSDQELLHLSAYLRNIAAHCDDFDRLDHRNWEHYKPPPHSRRKSSGSKRKADEDRASQN